MDGTKHNLAHRTHTYKCGSNSTLLSAKTMLKHSTIFNNSLHLENSVDTYQLNVLQINGRFQKTENMQLNFWWQIGQVLDAFHEEKRIARDVTN